MSTPVVFVHGLWLLASSWDRWAELFGEAGYTPVLAAWPDDPPTVAEARARPEALAGKTVGQIADHLAAEIGRLDAKPVVVGHSFGGLLAQILADRGLSAATVAIAPVAFRGILPLPLPALRAASPVLRNPANRGRAVMLTFEQFRYGFANAVSEDEARRLYETYSVPGAGRLVFQAAMANLNPRTELKVDVENASRGPLLIVAGEKDHQIPGALTRAAFKKQQRNPGVTEYAEISGRGHSLTIDGAWRDVATRSLDFVRRFAT